MTRMVSKLTKIIATIGPSTFDQKAMEDLVLNGVNIARLNLSHGTLDEHRGLISRLRKVSKKLNREIGILLDLPGPKVRLDWLPEPLLLTRSHKVALTRDMKVKTSQSLARLVIPAIILDNIKKRSVIAIDDGKVLLYVEQVHKDHAISSVIAGGEITSHKGISVLGVDLPLPALTAKDVEALALCASVDYVAVSFVRTAADVKKIRKKVASILKVQGGQRIAPLLVAKIETVGAVKNIDSIIGEVDAVMVARGDLALAVDIPTLGVLQKMIVAKARAAGKPVVVATQMLDSMSLRPLPSRAELLDVTNAVIDQVDATMLSTETASGSYPKESVRLMASIQQVTERSPYNNIAPVRMSQVNTPDGLFLQKLAEVVRKEKPEAIINATGNQDLAFLISQSRIEAIQIFVTPEFGVARALTIRWGIEPMVLPEHKNLTKELKGKVKKGKKIVHVDLAGKDEYRILVQRV